MDNLESEASIEFPGKKMRSALRDLGRVLFVTLAGACGMLLALTAFEICQWTASGGTATDVIRYYGGAKQSLSSVKGYVFITLVVVAIGRMVEKYLWSEQAPVLLLDHCVLKPDDELQVSNQKFIEKSLASNFFTKDAMDFQTRILTTAGLGEATYLPPGLHSTPPDTSMQSARAEAELVMFTVVQEVLEAAGVKPQEIGILIVNCSLFNPTPSLSSMIVNKFKMRSDIQSYNLAGMGCSASVIAIDLARELLQVYPNNYALVVSTENITQNWYSGNNRSMLIPNVLFRLGGAGILLTNKANKRSKAKYILQHVTRVHLGADDEACRCVIQTTDDDGKVGVELGRNIVKVCSKALAINMRKMGPFVLPYSEQFFFVLNTIARQIIGKRVKQYTPDFKTAFDHFCLHAGGRGVVDGLAKNLCLDEEKKSPTVNTLKWYGNTSSSTVWYSLAYIETVQGVQKGEIVWQVGFGSGFKCNSAVWKSLRTFQAAHSAWKHLK